MITHFKENIKLIQKAQRFTRKEMADKLGIGYSLYCKWCEGASKANHEDLANISEVFGISIDDLIKRPLQLVSQTS